MPLNIVLAVIRLPRIVPSSIKTYKDFAELLVDARAELKMMAEAEPDDGAISSVMRQLNALDEWTRNGRCPSQAEKDQLNFGLIASRELDSYPVADNLYELASFVIYWGEAGGHPE